MLGEDAPKTADAFEIPVGPEQRALDVFHHPYAYAACEIDPLRSGREQKRS